jgi:hypothetical protein
MQRAQLVVIAWVAMLGVSAAASAAEWSAQPRVTVALDTDSNRRLDTEAEDSQSLRIGFAAALAHAQPRQRIELRPRLDIARFDGTDRELDSNDYGLNVALQRSGERWQFDASVNGARDSTLTTELTDTGLIDGRTRRQSLGADVSASYAIGQRSTVQVSAGHSDIDFDRAEGTGLVPYGYTSFAAGYVFQVSERTELVTQAFGGRLDVPQSALTTDNVGVRAILRKRVSERFRFDASAGVSRTESDDRSDQSQVFSASVTWNNELTEVALSLSRNVEPSARGRLVDADSVNLNYRRRVSERLTVGVAGSYARREDLLFGFFPEEREYYNYSAIASLRVNPTLQLEAAAGRARQSFNLIERQASGERASLSLVWTPRQIAQSR